MARMAERNWGMILLAVYLILVGLAAFGLAVPPFLTGIIAIVAGVLLLVPLFR